MESQAIGREKREREREEREERENSIINYILSVQC